MARRTGVLRKLETADSGAARHLRSMFAIHDVDDLARLDLPWWVYTAAERVERFLAERAGRARVFEYGSGASSLWLARRSAEVHSVEHHPGFAELMASRVAGLAHVTLRHVPAVESPAPATPSDRHGHGGLDFTDYVAAIDAVPGSFDLVVIDGRARQACLARAAERIAEDGMIVFDNSNRGRYRAALERSGLVAEPIRGAAPCLPYPTETTLLTRPGGAAGRG